MLLCSVTSPSDTLGVTSQLWDEGGAAIRAQEAM